MNGRETMRLFIAILLTDEMRSSLIGTMHALKQVGIRGSYVPAQNLHLTLAFIGETDDAGAVKDAMQTLKFKSFRLSLSGLGTFGDRLWAGLRGNQGLSAVAKDLREALDEAGIPYDKKTFTPHITLVRRMNGNWQTVPAPKGEMMVRRISLMRSVLKDGKRVYTEIFSV